VALGHSVNISPGSQPTVRLTTFLNRSERSNWSSSRSRNQIALNSRVAEASLHHPGI
jgi:hypothetical protein